MKAAIKDLRSKFKDHRGSDEGGHMSSRHQHPYQNHHTFDPNELSHGDHSTTKVYSAPSSPVFRHTHSTATPSHKSPSKDTSSSHNNHNSKHNYRSSIQNMQFTPTNHLQNINHKHIAITKKNGGTSATSIGQSASSSSSNSSTSEMNLLQELQQHALFRTPMPYRSVSPTNTNCTVLTVCAPFLYSHLVNQLGQSFSFNFDVGFATNNISVWL